MSLAVKRTYIRMICCADRRHPALLFGVVGVEVRRHFAVDGVTATIDRLRKTLQVSKVGDWIGQRCSIRTGEVELVDSLVTALCLGDDANRVTMWIYLRFNLKNV